MTDFRLNANEARLLYFGDYVRFEHYLRRLVRKLYPDLKTKNESLKSIIKLIQKYKKENYKFFVPRIIWTLLINFSMKI